MKEEEGEGEVWQGLEPSTIAGFEDLWREPWAKEFSRPLGAENSPQLTSSKEMRSWSYNHKEFCQQLE